MPTPYHPKQTVLALLLAGLTLALPGCTTNMAIRDVGYKAMRQGDYQRARQQFALAAKRQPTDYLAQFYLGVTNLKLDKPVAAQLAFEKALALRPDGGSRNDAILDGIAQSLYEQQRYDALHAFLAKTASTHGQSSDYLRQAKYLAKTGDADGAITAFRKAAYFAKPGDAEPYLAMAKFYESIHDVPEAVKALKYANWVDPGNLETADELRKFGIVPGPTIRAQPPKPKMLNEG